MSMAAVAMGSLMELEQWTTDTMGQVMHVGDLLYRQGKSTLGPAFSHEIYLDPYDVPLSFSFNGIKFQLCIPLLI